MGVGLRGRPLLRVGPFLRIAWEISSHCAYISPISPYISLYLAWEISSHCASLGSTPVGLCAHLVRVRVRVRVRDRDRVRAG